MAEPVVVDLEARVVALVEARRDELADLVDEIIDRELQALVEAAIAARTNGAGNAEIVSTNVDTPRASEALALCSRCGAEPRMPGRTIGRDCRRRQQRARERRTASSDDAGDGPRPGDAHAGGNI